MTDNNIIPIEVKNFNNQLITTSLNIAEVFNKEHSKILRDIKNLNCSKEFGQANFGLAEYIDGQGKSRPCYNITKDGFTFLVMGYTGKKASKFKELYINKFNFMKKELKEYKKHIDSYMIDNPIERAEKWLFEQKQNQLLLEQKDKDIKDKEDTITLIKENIDERIYKKNTRSEIVQLVNKFSKSTGLNYSEIYKQLYNRFINLYPNIDWKMELFKDNNKLNYICNKDIKYVKDLKSVLVTMME